MAGYKTDRKHVPHSRGLKKADLVLKDFRLAGVREVMWYKRYFSCYKGVDQQSAPDLAAFVLPARR